MRGIDARNDASLTGNAGRGTLSPIMREEVSFTDNAGRSPLHHGTVANGSGEGQ